MIFRDTGQVCPGFHVTGIAGVPCYLFEAQRPALVDAGFSCLGELYVRDIKAVLGEQTPERLLLTHVHYDHCGAADHLRRAFPGLTVAASARAAEIMASPNAVALMERLSAEAYKTVSQWDIEGLIDEPFRPFTVDEVLADGDEVDLGDRRLQVLATPGHTRDFLSYYDPEARILVASEAVGCSDRNGHVMTEFLVDYDQYIASLRRLAALEVEVLCQGHVFVYTGRDAREFFDRSLAKTEEYRQQVERWLKASGGDLERVVDQVRRWEYDHMPFPKQPEPAYLLNTQARVKTLARRMGLAAEAS